jgi:5-methylcytosine-specific restriction endonuclease McrA
MPSKLQYIKSSTYYSNVLIISKEGKALSTVSDKRANWYLKNNLAHVVTPPEGYPKAIQLTFEPNPCKDPQIFELTVSKDECVLCGKKTHLTLHHVIPYVLRRHFPVEHKARQRQWCVLLCCKCHIKTEDFTQPLYNKDFPSRRINKNTSFTLQVLKQNGNINKIPPANLKHLFENSAYSSIEEIPAPNRRRYNKQKSIEFQALIKEWAHNFIKDHGGIDGTKAYFRDVFLRLNPKYLPEGYLDIGKISS